MSSTGTCFDIGNATRSSIEEFMVRQKEIKQKYKLSNDKVDKTTDPEHLKDFDPNCSDTEAAGNGSLMRLAPVPLFFYRDPVKAVEYSGISGVITHGDKRAKDACRYYGALIVAALMKESKDKLLANDFYEVHRSWFGDEELCKDILSIAHGSYKKPGGYEEGIRGGGYVVHALQAALWAFFYDQNDFEFGAKNAVNLGDDTDTTAAIYGQLAGACYGYKKLPEKWTKLLYANKFIEWISFWLCQEGDEWYKKSLKSHEKHSESRNDGTGGKMHPVVQRSDDTHLDASKQKTAIKSESNSQHPSKPNETKPSSNSNGLKEHVPNDKSSTSSQKAAVHQPSTSTVKKSSSSDPKSEKKQEPIDPKDQVEKSSKSGGSPSDLAKGKGEHTPQGDKSAAKDSVVFRDKVADVSGKQPNSTENSTGKKQ